MVRPVLKIKCARPRNGINKPVSTVSTRNWEENSHSNDKITAVLQPRLKQRHLIVTQTLVETYFRFRFTFKKSIFTAKVVRSVFMQVCHR